MFFTGMRTKQCRRLRANARCRAVYAIAIDTVRRTIHLDARRLRAREVATVVRKDGFLRDEEFWEFFAETHGARLSGQLIEWESGADSPAAKICDPRAILTPANQVAARKVENA